MSTEKIRSKEEATKKEWKMITSEVPPECLEDPRFINVLAASLCSEIATLELIQNETDAEIKGFKENVTKGLEKRKILKEFTQELTKKKLVLTAAVETIEREEKHRSIEVDIVKNRLDDATLREIADRAKYKKILDDYEETWEKYKATYEDHPLAKERQKACIALKQLQGQLMMAEYKKQNLITMLKQRKRIDNIRFKVSIVEISEMILERWKDQSHIHHLKIVATELQDKLNAYISQLSQLKQEKERKKRAEIEASMMPPPRLDFSFMRSIYNEQKPALNKRYSRNTSMRDSDAVSINTLMLEEMCNTTANDEDTEICRNRNQVAKENEEESLNIPIAISVIQEPDGPINSIVNELDIQKQLNKLSIKKKTTFAFDEKQQQRQAESNINNNDHGNIENESNGYKGGEEESRQRTRRWCEESQKKFAPLLAGKKSNSFNEQIQSGLIEEGCRLVGQKFTKASSIHGSEAISLRHEQEKHFKNGTSMENVDERSEAMELENFGNNGKRIDRMEMQDERKRRSGEKLRENTSIEDRAIHSRERILQNQISSPSVTTPANNQRIYEIPQAKTTKLDDKVASQESKTSDDNSELPIDTNCSRPKIRKIETVNYPLGLRPKDTIVINDSHQPDILYSPMQYVPSCMSSNLSNTFEAALQEIPQENFCNESKAITGFPLLSNWKNWSPPNSERSLASSISKIGQNNETPINEQHNPPIEQNQNSQFDFGGFFAMKPSQNTRNIF